MRELSSTLLAAQRAASHTPYVEVKAKNIVNGVVRLDWERLYTGTEDDYFHAVTLPGDGSLVRARITPPADSRRLYRQRVAGPGPASDFSQWEDTGHYNAVITACCALGTEVSIFWIKSDRKIYHLRSDDCGANWDSAQLLGYTTSTAINGIAAAYKDNGDIALFYADQDTLYVMLRTDGTWGSATAWDKSTGALSGAACVYDGDWNLFVTGRDTGGNYRLWSLVYGDGSQVTAGNWSDLKEFAAAPSDGGFEYQRAFLDKPDVYRGFFVEKFTGTESYCRPFRSHTVVDTGFTDSLWHEPAPFNLSSEYGLAAGHHGDYCWLTAPYGVWRASLAGQELDLTADVLSLKEEVSPGEGRLTVELRNDDGRYTAPGQGALAALDIGCQLSLSPGYRTAAGPEVSSGPVYSIESQEHTSRGGQASLVLYAYNGRQAVSDWQARHQLRWNRETDEASVKEMLAFVLARAGLKLETISQSPVVTGFYPDFTIHAGNRGETAAGRLLSGAPDALLFEGDKVFLIYPQASDSPVYAYGTSHPINGGRYKNAAWPVNRVRVEGYDPSGGTMIIADAFAWTEIDRLRDRFEHSEDSELETAAVALERGEARLRAAEIEATGGSIRVPANCGQQLYDVVEITDARAGLAGARRRIMGLVLEYDTRYGKYEHTLLLGGV